MKTPREILLQRHRGMTPKLDAIRKDALSHLRSATVPTARGTFNLADFLQSMRWHFAGLGAAWMLILLLNAESPASTPVATAQQNPPTPLQLLGSLQEHRRQLLRWEEEPPHSSGPLQPALPPRRSQLQQTNLNSAV